jgi:hypothetical protein
MLYSGYALGAATALMGKEAAMACTVAVEATITEHYNSQIRDLTQVCYESPIPCHAHTLFQSGGSGSAWIRIHFGRMDPDPDPGGQKLPSKVKKFQVLN